MFLVLNAIFFFTVPPLSLLWVISLAVSTMFFSCLAQVVILKKIMLYMALKQAVIFTKVYYLENSLNNLRNDLYDKIIISNI
jgi:hypothetical protein